jgi:DNA-binding NtrC family response regulator
MLALPKAGAKENEEADQMSAMSKVLVVDDDEVVRRSHLRSLSQLRCNVEGAWNGYEALRAMEQRAFDVVILDLRMPGMDGMTVLKTIKEKWPESEVIIITGYPSIETAKQAVRLGVYDYIAKPVGPDEVVRATNAAVTQKRWSLHRDRADKHGESARYAEAGGCDGSPAH